MKCVNKKMYWQQIEIEIIEGNSTSKHLIVGDKAVCR